MEKESSFNLENPDNILDSTRASSANDIYRKNPNPNILYKVALHFFIVC